MVPFAVGPGMSHSHGTPAIAVASTVTPSGTAKRAPI